MDKNKSMFIWKCDFWSVLKKKKKKTSIARCKRLGPYNSKIWLLALFFLYDFSSYPL